MRNDPAGQDIRGSLTNSFYVLECPDARKRLLSAVKQVVPSLAAVVLLASLPGGCAWASSDSAVGGVVRDTHGSPQMGALVELLGPDASVLARVVTDDHGRYSLGHLLPGTYKIRASAAFLLPAIRSNLTLRAGTRTLADLTMTAIFEAGSWLPAEVRSASDHADDWRWALRSTANRPMLRLVDDTSSSSSATSSSLEHTRPTLQTGELAILAGDGRFGYGGTHQVVSLGKAGSGGDISSVTASVGDNAAQGFSNSVEVAGSLERDRVGGGQTRIFAGFATHPELQVGDGAGVSILQTATTEVVTLGDAVIVDAGTLFTAERLMGSRFNSTPYLRLAFQPMSGVAVEYRLSTSRELQASSDLDEMHLQPEILSDAQGHPLLKKSLHQEVSVAHSGERARISFGVFHDTIPVEAIDGGGVLAGQDLSGIPVIADPTTNTLRVAVEGYTSTGARIVWTQALSPILSACLEGDYGSALAASSGTAGHLADVPGATHTRAAAAVRGSLHAGVPRTGTSATIHYRWQPKPTLTQVDEFDSEVGDASLGISLRQRLWRGKRLQGLNAVVEASNLLAQGYEPILGPDGQTLFLAQVPRSVQAGFTLTF